MDCERPPTQIGADKYSSLCTTGHRANLLTGVLLRLLQDHFSAARNLEFNGVNETGSDLKGYTWSADVKETRILVDTVWNWNAQNIQQRPAIYVRRDVLRSQKKLIGDRAQPGAVRGANGSIIEVPGGYYLREIAGSHTLFVIGGTGAEAELIGQEVFNHLTEFGPLIRQEYKFLLFEVAEWGALGKLEESHEHFVTPIVCRYSYAQSWRINKQAPWFKSAYVGVKAD